MGIVEWVGIGVIMLVAGVISVRIMRRGLPTYEENREKYLERMAQGHRLLDEDQKNISAREQLRMMRCALEDFVRLENADAWVEEQGNALTLHSVDNDWRVELIMRERMLASSKKVIHGQSRWLLTGPDVKEEHLDCARLMASLSAHWRGVLPGVAEPEFVARRLARSRRAARKNFFRILTLL